MSIADELRKLADLRGDGLLTDEEFFSQKKRLLFQAGEVETVERDAAFYGASVTAWLNYGLELNKQLLLFSSGGLALLLGLVSSDGFEVGFPSLYFVYICTVSYMTCMASVLGEFKMSRIYIQNMVTNRQERDRSFVLTLLGRLSVSSFIVGTICLTSFVIVKIH